MLITRPIKHKQGHNKCPTLIYLLIVFIYLFLDRQMDGAPTCWFNPPVPAMARTKLDTFCVSHTDDRNLFTWAIPAALQGLYCSDTGISGVRSWVWNPGTKIWDKEILTAMLKAGSKRLRMFKSLIKGQNDTEEKYFLNEVFQKQSILGGSMWLCESGVSMIKCTETIMIFTQ